MLAEAYTGKRVNPKSGREAKHYRCNGCAKEFTSKDVQVDHIKPIIDPLVGFTTWDDYINRLFCEKENLQVLCVDCHKIKTAQEREEKNANQSHSRVAGRKRKVSGDA